MTRSKKSPLRFDALFKKEIRLPIATKLTLSFLFIIIISSGIFTLVGVQIISSLILSEADERVRNDLNAARLIYTHALDHVSQAAKFTAARTFIEDILLKEDIPQTYINELRSFRVNENLDVLTFTDRNGIVVLRTNNPDNRGDDQSDLELVQAVLKDKKPVAGTAIISAEELQLESPFLVEKAHFIFVDTPMARPRTDTEQSAGMMLMSAIPVFDNSGTLIGVVYAGNLLNRSYAVVDEVKNTIFQGVVYNKKDIGTSTIFQDDVRISTNVHNGNGSRAIGTRIAEDVYKHVVVNGEQYVGRAYVVNDWYLAAYEPIRSLTGNIIGILYVGILEQKYTDIKNRATLIFLSITLIGVILSTFTTLLISRRISTSIGNLVIASKQLALGNLETTVEKTTHDEIGELADHFNLMATAIRKRDEKLKEFTKKKIMESERLALIGQLSANVAHELNNPLQGIITYSHLLLEENTFSDDARESINKIVVQANRCRDIIRGLLDFSRHKKPDKTLCNVNNLLKGCISLVEKQAAFHNIKVTMDLDEQLPMVVLDPSQIERVFLNLIINAAEAMDGNGQLTLSTRHNQTKTSIEINVQDTGHGVSEENMEKIFDPFFTTKETGHGVGLGLAISYGIVKDHNGSLSVESEEGKGTIFTVSFPLTKSKNGTDHGN
jgi:two-component system, NtrC family, sensor kinase